MEYMDIIKLGVPLLALAGGYGGIRAMVNGTIKRVDTIEGTQLELVKTVSSMETKIDILLERK